MPMWWNGQDIVPSCHPVEAQCPGSTRSAKDYCNLAYARVVLGNVSARELFSGKAHHTFHIRLGA
jgi:hypothetical protein